MTETLNKSITIVSSHYKPHWGGIERFADMQSRAFESLGYEVRVITHDTEKVGFIERHGRITIYRLACISFMQGARFPFPSSVRQLLTVYRECFACKPTFAVVHARYYLLSVLGCLWGWLSNTKVVVIDHSSNYIQLGNAVVSCLARAYEHSLTFAMRMFRPSFYGVAQACVHWLRQFSIEAKGVYYNGIETQAMREAAIDIRAQHNFPPQTRVVLSVGRLVKEKGVGELVKAFEHFSKRHPDFVLMVIGYGELESEIAAAAKSNHQLIFLGRQPPEVVWAHMKQADVFVNPSNYPEGMPTIILEAGYYGLTVISTLNGGAAEVIIDGQTGVAMPRGDQTSIGLALERVATSFDSCRRLGECLRDVVVSKFSFDGITRRFEQEIVGER